MTQTPATKEFAGFEWDLMLPSNIDTEINECREWEPCVSNWIRGKLTEGDVAIDVGANIGWFSLLMSKQVGPKGKVHAFEPEPSFRERLQRNIAMNELENIQVHRCGLSDKSEEGWIVKNVGPYFSSATMKPSYPCHEHSTQVHCFALDEVFSGPVSLIKIDVDGYEMPALRGAQQAIDLWSPHIVVEIADQAPAEFLEALGYEFCYGYEAVETRALTVDMIPDLLNDGMPTINIFGVRK
jgi:FkbM family methyltransferase